MADLSGVPIDWLEPNPWNTNALNDRTQRALHESIQEFGFIDPVVVRRLPDDEHPRYQIIDGEHRWKAAKDEGYTECPVFVIDVDDMQAQRLTIILNETRGDSPEQDLANALAALAEQDEIAARRGLPYDNDEWQRYMDMAGLEQPDGQPDEKLRAEGEWVTITATVSRDFQQTWEAASEQAEHIYGNEGTTLHDDPRIRAGQVLELIVADFLAS